MRIPVAPSPRRNPRCVCLHVLKSAPAKCLAREFTTNRPLSSDRQHNIIPAIPYLSRRWRQEEVDSCCIKNIVNAQQLHHERASVGEFHLRLWMAAALAII